MNVCLICEASLGHHTLYMGNLVQKPETFFCGLTYYHLNWISSYSPQPPSLTPSSAAASPTSSGFTSSWCHFLVSRRGGGGGGGLSTCTYCVHCPHPIFSTHTRHVVLKCGVVAWGKRLKGGLHHQTFELLSKTFRLSNILLSNIKQTTSQGLYILYE